MTTGKRLFDVVCALGVMVLVSPIMVWIAFRIWRMRDGPVFYVAERMNGPDRAFGLIKFRTMTTVSADNAGVTGGDKTDRITCLLYTSPSPRDLSTSRMPSSA